MNAANVIPLSTPQAAPRAKSAQPPAPDPLRMRFDAFELDEANALLVRDGSAVAVAPRPFAVLCALARQPGCLVTKHKLLDDVWGHQFVSDSVLKTAISDLRAVLDDDPRQPRVIETVSRRGYRFIAATTAISTAAAVRANVPEIDFAEQRSFIGRSKAPSRLSGAWATAQRAVSQVVRDVDISIREIGCALSEPAFATTEDVHYAHELRLRLRAQFLGHPAVATAPCSVGAD
jgi:DNA-binding winged helix-turn-helix (wHTH) protein